MYFPTVKTFLFVGTLINQTMALGINCRGSPTCTQSTKTSHAVKTIAGFINDKIQPCRIYRNGEHIACITDGNILASNGGFCAFLQNTPFGASGLDIQALITSLNSRTDDECNNCGSIPITFPYSLGGVNADVGKGQLTVNFVGNTANPCPTGLC